MEAINRAFEGADAFRKMMDKVATPDAPAPARNISREVDEWNERVDREKFEKARAKRARALEDQQRSIAERLR